MEFPYRTRQGDDRPLFRRSQGTVRRSGAARRSSGIVVRSSASEHRPARRASSGRGRVRDTGIVTACADQYRPIERASSLRARSVRPVRMDGRDGVPHVGKERIEVACASARECRPLESDGARIGSLRDTKVLVTDETDT